MNVNVGLRNFALTFVIMMGVAVGGYTLIHLNWYPAAIVNGAFVSARTLNEAATSANQYYREMTRAQGAALEDAELPPLELQRVILDQLIQNELVADEVEHRVGRKEVASLVQAKIDALGDIEAPQFEKAVQALYGLTSARFRTLVLEPRARDEILTERLSASPANENAGSVVDNLRKDASVHILIRGFLWKDGKVVIE